MASREGSFGSYASKPASVSGDIFKVVELINTASDEWNIFVICTITHHVHPDTYIVRPVASLRLVSPRAVTDGVTFLLYDLFDDLF